MNSLKKAALNSNNIKLNYSSILMSLNSRLFSKKIRHISIQFIGKRSKLTNLNSHGHKNPPTTNTTDHSQEQAKVQPEIEKKSSTTTQNTGNQPVNLSQKIGSRLYREFTENFNAINVNSTNDYEIKRINLTENESEEIMQGANLDLDWKTIKFQGNQK